MLFYLPKQKNDNQIDVFGWRLSKRDGYGCKSQHGKLAFACNNINHNEKNRLSLGI